MEKKNIIRVIGELARGESDRSIFDNMLPDMDELNDKEIDVVLVKNMKSLEERLCCGTFDDSWRGQVYDISHGNFPLEELPEHVRELAKELYYD